MSNIGKYIKERRESLGISQDELAEKMGYKSRSTIAKIEKGVNDVTQTNIVKFAEVLKTTPAYLMGWEEKVEEDPIGEANKLAEWYLGLEFKDDDAGLKSILEAFDKLDNSKREQLKDYANFLLTMQEGK